MKCIDKGDLVGAVFIDFRKAFDVVDHSILLNKLALYKLNPSAIQWFKSYLCSQQQVIESDKRLTFHYRTIWCASGLNIGPTLFLIFINDLPLHIKKCSFDLYADDMTIHTHSNDIDAIEDLQGEFSNTKTWGKINKMNVHMTKTTCMLVGARKRVNDSQPLNIIADDVNIQSVSKQKLYQWTLFLVCPYRPLMLLYLI